MSTFWTGLSVLLLFSLMAASGQAKTMALRDVAPTVITELQAKGIHQIGNVDLEKLKTEFLNIELREFTMGGGAYLVGSGERKGAINLTEKKVVVINPSQIAGYSPRQTVLTIVHEYLGACGYNDENYEVTSRIFTLATEKPEIQHDVVFSKYQAPAKRTENHKYSSERNGGTVTGIGGGGDGAAAEIKSTLVARGLNAIIDVERRLKSSDTDSLREKLIALNVELTEKTDFYFFDKNKSGALRLNVNAHAWNKIPEGEKQTALSNIFGAFMKEI